MVATSIDLVSAVQYAIKFFKSLGHKKIPAEKFIRRIEKRYKIRLSNESKEDILLYLEEKGIIKLVKSRDGKVFVILGDIKW